MMTGLKSLQNIEGVLEMEAYIKDAKVVGSRLIDIMPLLFGHNTDFHCSLEKISRW